MISEKASFILQIMKYEPTEEMKRRKGKEEQIVLKTHLEALDDGIKALEKQIPRKPKKITEWDSNCQICGWEYLSKEDNVRYCPYCGQAIDWSE